MLVYNVLVILRRKRHHKRNLDISVMNYPNVYLICLSEAVRRVLLLSGCDIYLGDADKDKIKIDWIDLKWISSEDNL